MSMRVTNVAVSDETRLGKPCVHLRAVTSGGLARRLPNHLSFLKAGSFYVWIKQSWTPLGAPAIMKFQVYRWQWFLQCCPSKVATKISLGCFIQESSTTTDVRPGEDQRTLHHSACVAECVVAVG